MDLFLCYIKCSSIHLQKLTRTTKFHNIHRCNFYCLIKHERIASYFSASGKYKSNILSSFIASSGKKISSFSVLSLDREAIASRVHPSTWKLLLVFESHCFDLKVLQNPKIQMPEENKHKNKQKLLQRRDFVFNATHFIFHVSFSHFIFATRAEISHYICNRPSQ